MSKIPAVCIYRRRF